jgi:uncharacterized protein YjbI with pentapeptide repeats
VAKLGGADLRAADLYGAELRHAHLREANLSWAKLGRAKLENADLRAANLDGAQCYKADLGSAKLGGADLRAADFTEAYLRGADLSSANLDGAFLYDADLRAADLSGADLSRAHLNGAYLGNANLRSVNLRGANLSWANLGNAVLIDADLSGANLEAATLVSTDFTGADLTGARVHGVSAWRLKLERAKQQNLVITREDEPTVTVDNIEVAQFVYLLLHNEKIRNVIDTIGKKGVLLLGRFTEGRIVVLERLREKLRDLGFVPMVFNFDKPETKDFTETVRLLCNLSHFVIVDITNPRSAPLELQATVPDYMVPFAPILQQGEEPFSMFVDLQNKYDWVLQPVVGYPSVDRLIEVLEDEVIRPAEAKFNELLSRRTNELRVKNI